MQDILPKSKLISISYSSLRKLSKHDRTGRKDGLSSEQIDRLDKNYQIELEDIWIQYNPNSERMPIDGIENKEVFKKYGIPVSKPRFKKTVVKETLPVTKAVWAYTPEPENSEQEHAWTEPNKSAMKVLEELGIKDEYLEHMKKAREELEKRFGNDIQSN